jgi:hypothetical protein
VVYCALSNKVFEFEFEYNLTEQDAGFIAQTYPETEGDADKLNEKRRKATYRNFFVRNYGHLGPGIRIPIPQ